MNTDARMQNAVNALVHLFTRELSDAEVECIATATAALISGHVNFDDVPEMLRLMGQVETATWLGINRSTLSQWTNQDDDPVPALRLGDKPVYLKTQLVRWLQSRPYANMRS
jgi:hypothetical protein